MWDAKTGAKLQQPELSGPNVSGSDVTSVWVRNKLHHDVHWTSTMDGWIVSLPGQNNLMWMPQGIREVVQHPFNTLIISQQGYAQINFQGCNIGTNWAKCYKPLLV